MQATMESDWFKCPQTFVLADYWNESKTRFVEKLPVYAIVVLAHRSIIGRLTHTNQFAEVVERKTVPDKQWETVTIRLHTK